MSKIVAVKCKICKTAIPMNTRYILTMCKCDDSRIGIDGGQEYVRMMGEPDQFIYLDKEGNEVKDE